MKKELEPEPVPDPLVRVTDPGIRIRTKMSWIPNTGSVRIADPDLHSIFSGWRVAGIHFSKF
jgi:hypothetical protein